jgi:virulence-associated protein VagC
MKNLANAGAKRMRARVTQIGLLIPKALLEGVDEVEIHQEQQRIMIVPVAGDRIRKLGLNPLDVDETNASEHHDEYLYPS